MNDFRLVMKKKGSLNPFWKNFNEKHVETITSNPIFNSKSRLFTLGSCFAVEIRKVLKKQGIAVFPALESLEFDLDRYRIGDLPVRENFNYYNTFSIEQELARAVGLWQQDVDDYWLVDDAWWGTGGKVYQDPYRRCVFGRTHSDIVHATQMLDNLIKEGARSADGFLITLGLIEVWRNKKSQKIACMEPGYNQGGGKQESEFHLSNFDENMKNLENIVSHIAQINAHADIVFTVSPVPLGRTFTGNDVFVANMESKSLLRTAAAQISRNHDHVHYFQSYDICAANNATDVYLEDGRHVQPQMVKLIVNGFIGSFFKS